MVNLSQNPSPKEVLQETMLKKVQETILNLVAQVEDPEIPGLTIEDLGILRDVILEESKVIILIAPTYMACPAYDVIASDIHKVLGDAGYCEVEVRHQFDPPWTTDWITLIGRKKLLDCQIALPEQASSNQDVMSNLFKKNLATCPNCQSKQTEIINNFSSTLCKSMHKCFACKEPFETLKCH